MRRALPLAAAPDTQARFDSAKASLRTAFDQSLAPIDCS